jgi:hypothetical protein
MQAKSTMVQSQTTGDTTATERAPDSPRTAERSPDATNALRLLQLESDIRRAETEPELVYHLANEARSALGFRQAFVVAPKRQRFVVRAVSSMAAVEKDAPLTRWVAQVIARLDADQGVDKISQMTADAYGSEQDNTGEEYPFRHLMWVPLKTRDGRVFAGLLAARETPWGEREKVLGARLADTYAHAWLALTRKPLRGLSRVPRLALRGLLLAGVVALGFLPVPITTIAPVQVVGKGGGIVAAPLDGVISEIAVEPNQIVARGDLLFRIQDTELRNAAEIAAQKVLVAQARVEQLETGSFIDPEARRQLTIARAELKLSEAELTLARERVSRVEVHATSDGLVTFGDAQELLARPVSIGQQVMQLADPERVEFFIPLPVGDLIVLDGETRVRVFLDADPLTPILGDLNRANYHATMQPDGTLAYELRADLPPGAELPRIGSRGAAQVLGPDAPLYFVLLRRPIAWFRQTFGV